MDFVLHHDGTNWCLHNEQLSLSAPSMALLDADLRRMLQDRGLLRSGERKRVRMMFDSSTLPQVIRQYAQHYFNRVLEIEG